ncbi:vegetative cell wall protein gp1 [Phaeosphaeria sp. MPI-PUGE-AT-0046c]|nr:vegetative cell wall protein gp1 [Phaeosphaeria sp. MPI-PUGE-AT-0046c]
MADPQSDFPFEPPNKRQRTSAMYQRKRAVTACEPCRRRKTRCDNARPICGFCQINHGQCSYPDSSSDYATYDPASLAILDRLNHVVTLLETQSVREPVSWQPLQDKVLSAVTPASHTSSHVVLGARAISSTQDRQHGNTSVYVDDELFGRTNIAGHPATLLNCESILKWPVFGAPSHPIHSFVLEHATNVSTTTNSFDSTQPGNRGIQENDFSSLSKRFLTFVHVKNPVLDIEEYQEWVKIAVDQGPRWDGPSCLVLITCALGCLTEPFECDYEPDFADRPARTEQRSPHIVDMETAQSYYMAAKKRLSLIDPSHLLVECLFFFGVFEMYCLRPLKAWNYFNSACVQCRNLLWMRSQTSTPTDLHDRLKVDLPIGALRLIEQRLYWSCLKSELELRCEIPLPQSGLANFDQPDLFPTPPANLISRKSENGLGETGHGVDPDHQRGWLYYLSEISHRRMINRAITTMSPPDVDQAEGWVKNIWANIQHVKDLEHQIDTWCSCVPPPIDERVSDHELAHFVQSRSIMCREWIHRPFLYYVIHQPREGPHMEQALPLAEKCIQHCVDLIFRIPKHRQHGLWFVCRATITRALLVVAAIRSQRFSLSDRWTEALEIAKHFLHRYKHEAPDLEQAFVTFNALVSCTLDSSR